MTKDVPASLPFKVAKMAALCARIPKAGFNAFHKYSYATASDVLARVNEAMEEVGVCSTVAVEIIKEQGDTVTVRVRLTIHDADSPSFLVTEGIGSGQDKGDKAVMKAQTAALKYAWMMALNISTCDDPEADESTDRRANKGVPPARTQVQPATRPQTQDKAQALWESLQERMRHAGIEPWMPGPSINLLDHIKAEATRAKELTQGATA